MALCALTIVANADYNYKCGISSVEYDDSQSQPSKPKYIYKLTIQQTAKNTTGYSNTDTYKGKLTLTLTSDDGTLEGTYTTEGFVGTGTTYDQNYIVSTTATSLEVEGKNPRYLNPNKISTFTITKEGENLYSIGENVLYFVNNQFNPSSYYTYRYCYNIEDLNNPDVAMDPFVFGVDTEYHQKVYNYDMTVNGISVMRDDSDYGEKRYFLTLNCVGVKREDNSSRNYEVQLAIYPGQESIVGTFSTRVGALLWASNSYVKDLKINKTRYLANDSTSTIQIKSKGENQYSFYGGTLTCTDLDLTYYEVHREKRIAAVHYYHFSDNDGEGIEFGYDESNKTIELTINKVDAEATINGIDMEISAKDPNNSSYTVYVVLESSTIDGTFTTANGLSLWSKVSKGSIDAEVQSGSTITINAKSGNTHTISGSMLCDNEYTYILKAFDFQYGEATGLESIQQSAVSLQKVLREGQVRIIRENKTFNVLGSEVK